MQPLILQSPILKRLQVTCKDYRKRIRVEGQSVKDERQKRRNSYEVVCADKRQGILTFLPFTLYPLYFTLLVFLSSCGKPDTTPWPASGGTREAVPLIGENPARQREETAIRSQNYKFITPLSRSEEDGVIARVEVFHAELCKAFSPGVHERKVATIEIVSDKEAFTARVSQDKPEVLEPDSALFIKTRVILVHLGVDTQPLFRALFRHQTRLYLYDLTRRFPLWIEEGIISFFEEVSVSQERYRITGYSADKMERLQALLTSGNYPQFRQLTQLTQSSDFTEQHRLVSWGFTYWAQIGGPNTNRVVYKNYLRAVLEKGAENVNIEDFLHMTLEEFQKRWEKWILKQEIYKKGGDK